MNEQHEPTADDPVPGPSRWRGSAGASIRIAVGLAIGVTIGVATRDIGLGVSTGAAALNILGEMSTQPVR